MSRLIRAGRHGRCSGGGCGRDQEDPVSTSNAGSQSGLDGNAATGRERFSLALAAVDPGRADGGRAAVLGRATRGRSLAGCQHLAACKRRLADHPPVARHARRGHAGRRRSTREFVGSSGRHRGQAGARGGAPAFAAAASPRRRCSRTQGAAGSICTERSRARCCRGGVGTGSGRQWPRRSRGCGHAGVGRRRVGPRLGRWRRRR